MRVVEVPCESLVQRFLLHDHVYSKRWSEKDPWEHRKIKTVPLEVQGRGFLQM